MSANQPPPLLPEIVEPPLETPESAARGAAFPVVGIGASAGGLEALTQFLRALPEKTGMSFVIVQHLAPDRESILAQLLSRATAIPVCEVCDEPEVEPDRVYVVPPGRDMIIAGGKLRLRPQDRLTRHHAIDHFFRSLAGDCGRQAIGVVLSGNGSDGASGLAAIKDGGGITFAQDGSAAHESMPRSAAASGCADFILAPAEIAAELAGMAPSMTAAPHLEDGKSVGEGGSDLIRIVQILRLATGVDFTRYKANTLQRRIERRMVLNKLAALTDYEDYLRRTPKEAEALYEDILISVTSFFRNPEAFEAVARLVFPKLLAGHTGQAPARIWTLGCSTGEEAYSLAIAFAECAEAAGSSAHLQLFATDLNGSGISKARAGIYPKSIAQDLSQARLRRFFTEEADGYRICKSIRERCVFSRHNVLHDPPFSRIDLISCRNVLIYMQPSLQRQIVPLLHYALKPEGFLWLGNSETAGASSALFELTDARHKIYARLPDAGKVGRPVLPPVDGAANGLFPSPLTGAEGLPPPSLHKKWNRGTPNGGKAVSHLEAIPDSQSAVPASETDRLTQELAATRAYLQAIIEQQEAANEELQAANEEAQSANEEIQSVNEELETSKEEIQSTNEELARLNDELHTRNLQLDQLTGSLRLARDYAENIVASVRSPLVVLDAALRVKTANRAYFEVFCVPPGETEGELIYDLGNGQWNIPALRTLLEELLPRDDQIDDFEVRHTFEQIGPRIMLLNARRLSQAADHEPLIVLAIEDITGRSALKDSLLARASDLARAGRSKDEFLAMLAHELRNPLAPLRNASEILRTADADSEVREQAHGILARQIENMTRMIDDLLDVSRITEGKIDLRKQVVALESVFNAAASLARPGVATRGQMLDILLPAEPVFLNADATRLDQIFGNLLANACKYSGRGCRISLSAERAPTHGNEPPEVIVRVRDDGIGIAPELLPRIFDLFVQATRALDRAHGGLGIGLTLVQRLVKLHDGSVEARSEGLGHGSEFIVRLPILPAQAAAPGPPQARSDRDKPRRILIVDDNEDSTRSMSALQRLRGHETRTAFTGPEAVAACTDFSPEVVLLDIGLPGMDGFEVARRLRAMPKLAGAFLVAMTGYGSDDDLSRAKAAGFDEYLVKPVDLDILRAWLRDRPCGAMEML